MRARLCMGAIRESRFGLNLYRSPSTIQTGLSETRQSTYYIKSSLPNAVRPQCSPSGTLSVTYTERGPAKEYTWVSVGRRDAVGKYDIPLGSRENCQLGGVNL